VEFSKKGNDVFRKIETFPIPVIAAINGFALGGGCEISMSCDIRICSENAIFGQPEVRLGIIPGFGGTQRLSRFIGLGMAKQMIYTGQNINAKEALRIGLVNAIYPKKRIIKWSKKIALSITKNNPREIKDYKKEINEEKINSENIISFIFQIKYKTNPGEDIYIYGNNTDFGNWEQPKFKLKWSNGHLWRKKYKIPKSSYCIQFKFACFLSNKNLNIWEEGQNRLLCPSNLNVFPKTSDGEYILDFIWNHFKINFNIHYLTPNMNTQMNIDFEKATNIIDNWKNNNKKPIKMELQNNKEITAKDGNKITGFWTVTIIVRNTDLNNLYFEYKYSLIDLKNNSSIWEREPNRVLQIFF